MNVNEQIEVQRADELELLSYLRRRREQQLWFLSGQNVNFELTNFLDKPIPKIDLLVKRKKMLAKLQEDPVASENEFNVNCAITCTIYLIITTQPRST